MFDKAKDLYQMQKKAKELKSQLKTIHVEAEVDGVSVTVDGEQNVVEVKFAKGLAMEPGKLSRSIKEAMNKAIKKSQQVGAEKMKAIMGDMGGMFGQ